MDTTERVIAIIGCPALGKGPCGVTEISKELGLSKSSAYRVLSSLKRAQWVAQDPKTKKYNLGTRVLELGLSMVSQLDLRSASLPYLNELRSTTHEAAMLSARVGLERIFIDQLQSNHEVRQVVELGRRFPLWLGAPGKAMLAFMEESEIEMVIDNLRKLGVHILASGQVLDIDRLREELAKIRRQGFAVTVGERLIATPAVAAPIFGRDQGVVGAISVGGPLPTFSVDQAVRYGPLVSQVSSKISLQLGNASENVGPDNI